MLFSAKSIRQHFNQTLTTVKVATVSSANKIGQAAEMAYIAVVTHPGVTTAAITLLAFRERLIARWRAIRAWFARKWLNAKEDVLEFTHTGDFRRKYILTLLNMRHLFRGMLVGSLMLIAVMTAVWLPVLLLVAVCAYAASEFMTAMIAYSVPEPARELVRHLS